MSMIKIDLRTRYIEMRDIKQGNEIHAQSRSRIENLDGSCEFTKWKTSIIITNYFSINKPVKLGFIQRILKWLRSNL